MDGSGRWAEQRGWPRSAGHRAGAEAVRRTVAAAPTRGINTLTLFAFSAANWRRPAHESALLMEIFRDYLAANRSRHLSHGVRVSVIGCRARLPLPLVNEIERAERATARCAKLHLRLAIDYSAREALVEAARRWTRAPLPGELDEARACDAEPYSGNLAAMDDFARALAEAVHDPAPAPDVDLLVRTGGEKRLSDCLLWEGAFAEIVFTERLWPDFGAADLDAVIAEFHRRERRFGGVLDTVAS
jgi:undecaprenyl diphosphate synthase